MIDHRIKEQLALEFNCRPDDFDRDDNVITKSCLHENRRKFSDTPFFLQMATFGGNAVISADEKLHPWLENWVKGKNGFWLFEQHNFYELECELRKHGFKMALTHHMFLPAKDTSDFKTDIKVKWLEQEDIHPFYGREEFSNALCDRFNPERPDVLAVIALDGEKIMGMAGCSADTPLMWQIGIDVLSGYEHKGLAVYLVTKLKEILMDKGIVPFYGTSESHSNSMDVAIRSGFMPSFTEVFCTGIT
jgi:hypothetical protein